MKKHIYTHFILSITALFLVSTVFASFSLPVHKPLGPVSLTDSSINKDSSGTLNLKSALDEFKSLSRQDRKNRINEAKSFLKEYKSKKAKGDDVSTNTLLLVILAILLPPLAVYLHENAINAKFWISLLLTLIFWLPGVIYALIVILG